MTGSGDIAPLAGDGVLSIQRALIGTFVAPIPLIVAGAMFITAVVLIFIPYLLAHQPQAGSGDGGGWPLQITPAAALSLQQAISRFSQVIARYTPTGGYYPLAPWAGFAVECALTVAVGAPAASAAQCSFAARGIDPAKASFTGGLPGPGGGRRRRGPRSPGACSFLAAASLPRTGTRPAPQVPTSGPPSARCCT